LRSIGVIAGYELRVAGCGLRVTSCGLRGAGYGCREKINKNSVVGIPKSEMKTLDCGFEKRKKFCG
jgi:hypothetical protein